jgi:hypothetical protein
MSHQLVSSRSKWETPLALITDDKSTAKNFAFSPKKPVGLILTQPEAAGILLVPEARGNPLAAHLDQVRPDLPGLRQVLRLDQRPELMAARWRCFLYLVGCASAAGGVLPAVAPSA